MHDVNSTSQRTSRGLAWPIAIFVIAVMVGMPSLRGGFLSGDDYHLVRNHVLVNHPSISHALKLFTIVHRDLYQPIPLVSFSLDFAVVGALGLDPTDVGPNAGAWVFHLTNVLIHAACTVLVFFLMRRLSGRDAIAAVAACLFAVHPLASEPIAWLNGRMFLLSTLFTIATVIAFARWDGRPTIGRGVLTIVLVFLAHMSKVSVALPILIAVVPLAQRRRPAGRWWRMWIVVSMVTVVFTVFNAVASREMFRRASEEMVGSPVLHVLLALGQYFRQYVIPTGLSPWYPPPQTLHWWDWWVVVSAVTLAGVAIVAIRFAGRWRVVWLGLLWFLVVVGPTLPIVPARRVITADRYAYPANVGLHWIAASAVIGLFDVLRRRSRAQTARRKGLTDLNASVQRRWSAAEALLVAACAAAFLALLSSAWQAQSFYFSNIAKAERIVEINPAYPSVYESAAWAHYRERRYEQAIETAMKELENHPKKMACKVYQVVGMSQARLARYDDAIASLHKAIEADPAYGKCYSRLAQIQAMMGRTDDAVANYIRAIKIMPVYAPAIISLGQLYRTTGQTEQVVQTFERVLEINPYDVTANLALAETDLERHRYTDAIQRLSRLLDWMPENTIGRTNLGLALEAHGQVNLAIEAYTTAIKLNPGAVIAAVNLANLFVRQDRFDDAWKTCERALANNPGDLTLLITFHDIAQRMGRSEAAAEAFLRVTQSGSEDAVMRAWTSYALIHARRWDAARSPANELPGDVDVSSIRLLTQTLIALHDNDSASAIELAGQLLALDSSGRFDARDRLLGDLESFAAANPQNPWPYYLSAQVLIRQNRRSVAELAVAEFLRLCPTDDCRARADALLR